MVRPPVSSLQWPDQALAPRELQLRGGLCLQEGVALSWLSPVCFGCWGNTKVGGSQGSTPSPPPTGHSCIPPHVSGSAEAGLALPRVLQVVPRG